MAFIYDFSFSFWYYLFNINKVKMYKIICNGKNLNYGKNNEVRYISDEQFNRWRNKRDDNKRPFYMDLSKWDGSGRLIITELKALL